MIGRHGEPEAQSGKPRGEAEDRRQERGERPAGGAGSAGSFCRTPRCQTWAVGVRTAPNEPARTDGRHEGGGRMPMGGSLSWARPP